MVRERSDGLWTLPGGWADVGSSPGEVATDEVREEAGLTVNPTRIIALYDRDRHEHPPIAHHTWKLFMECESTVGSPRPGLETDDVGFFTEEELPPLSTTRVTERQLARVFRHRREPGQQPDFD